MTSSPRLASSSSASLPTEAAYDAQVDVQVSSQNDVNAQSVTSQQPGGNQQQPEGSQQESLQNQQQPEIDTSQQGSWQAGTQAPARGDVNLTLEQPDEESRPPVVAPEVVRGRVVRATELWHKQLSQQEAQHQAAHLSRELANLQGQNQKERLAVPLLRLAGAVQAALTWQHKVGQYSVESRAEVQQHHSPVRKQASGISTRASLGSRASQTKRAPSGEVLRAVQQMEAQLRMTRQDALQLATAVVRLEKEKAVLQAQASGISTQMPAGISEQQQQQLQQQQQESGTRVVDGQLVLQAQSEPVTSSTGDHASQGNPAAWDKQAQQAQQAQREAPQNVEACFHGAPTQPETAVLPAAVADADNKSQGFGAGSQQQQIHWPALRPSGVHLVVDAAHGAENAAEDKSQHAQHADGIHSPRSAHAVHGHASSFRESTASSRAHHVQDLSSQHAQRGHDKPLYSAAHELPASHHAAEITQDDVEKPQAEVHGTQPAPDGNVSHEHAHSERESGSRDFVNQTCLLHQTADEEITLRPLDKTASHTEPKQRGLVESRRPSFMRPTASSIAHNVSTLPKGLNKSLSTSVV
ncbi:MAG: hypothetical protein FRX49_11408 [Trebouxia sp. A1-2]|nr:MAG: hypothetical protein FRX49_11408 [Trebouxia sp. A1-2]